MILQDAYGLFSSGQLGEHVWLFRALILLTALTGVFIVVGLFRALYLREAWVLVHNLESITRLTGYFAALLVPVLAGSMMYEVLSRYLFNAPTYWAYELSYMLMGTILICGIGFCTLMRGHIRIDFLYMNFLERTKSFIDITGYVFLLLPAAIWITFALFGYFIDAVKINETSGQSAWGPIVWPFKFMLFYGMFIFCLQIIADTIGSLMIILQREAVVVTNSENH